MRTRILILALATAAAVTASAQRQSAVVEEQVQTPPGTFSILAFDPETQEIGAAVMSKVFSVGNGVIWAEAGVGAVATQATVDVSYGPQGLALLRQGLSPADIVKKLLADDPDAGLNGRAWPKTGRQFAVMNAKGESDAHTGTTAQAWAGHRAGKYCTAQGNILASEEVVIRMIAAFEKETGENGRRLHLSQRLVAALEGGKSAGGDKRTYASPHSAALIVVKKDAGPWLHNDVVLRLQVDEHADPIAELRRLVEMAPPARRGRGRGGM
jgi:uncharacterized Ntn-hydrolase superfamily protein